MTLAMAGREPETSRTCRRSVRWPTGSFERARDLVPVRVSLVDEGVSPLVSHPHTKVLMPSESQRKVPDRTLKSTR